MSKETASTLLKILTDCEFIHFTSRCNKSIEIAMLVLKKLGRETVLFQEEGGWLTYEKYIQQAQLEAVKLITDDGLLYEKEFDRYDMNSAVIVNSFAGYIALHDMASLMSAAAKNDMVVINDVSGSIGMKEGKIGDIIVGSFGKGKPVNLGEGGFIATNDEEIYNLIREIEFDEPELPYFVLEEKLRKLDARRKMLQDRAAKVKVDLADLDIAHKDQPGLNVVIRFANDEEKQRIIEYCKKEELEYTECPRKIRILDNAISIEVKRLD